MISKKRRRRPDRETDVRTYGRMDRWTYQLDSTPLGSFGTQCVDKSIVKLDAQTGNVFVLISSVGVQRRDAFI